MFETIIMKYLLPALIPTIGTAITWAMSELTKFIKTKTKNLSAESAMNQLSEVVNVVVSDLKQTVAKDFIKASADGKLSAEEKAALKAQATERVLSHLPSTTKKILEVGVTSLEEFISGKIEQAVYEKK